MTIPIMIGWPQLVLFLLAVVGLGLLISCALSLWRRTVMLFDEDTRKRIMMRRRKFRWLHGIGGIILLLLGVSMLWLTLLIQTYISLGSDIRVAQVYATSIANMPHMMSVELKLYNQRGQQTSDSTYLVRGDEWMLEGDIIKFPTWLNVLGLHSGYKLTRLEGRYDNPTMEADDKHTVIVLNGGDDNFFTTVQERAWLSPIIEAGYGSSTFLRADGKTYNVLVSQTGLYAEPAR